MTSIDDLLTKAEARPVPYRDVDVWLGEDVSSQMMDLEDQLQTVRADLRFGDPRPAEIEAEMDKVRSSAEGEIAVLRFRKLPSAQWSEIVARSPMRIDAPIDRQYNFNITQVSRIAASTSGARVDGDTEEQLAPEQWERLLTLLSGYEFEKIAEAIFYLNVFGPEQRVIAAKKALRAGTDEKST